MTEKLGHNPLCIAPSLLAADFAQLGIEVQKVLAAGADWIHFDVMDNHYVPNLSFGPLVFDALKSYTASAFLDVHLMAEPVDELIKAFVERGANLVSIHPSTTRHLDRSLSLIKDGGALGGLAINPAEDLPNLVYCQDKLDLLLLMSVNPGFGAKHSFPAYSLN